jgi:DNA primase
MNIEIERIKKLNFSEILAGYSITPKQKTNQGGSTSSPYSFMTHCPFHDDKNPSFSVTQNTDGVWLWRCFACNIGGTVIDFVMRKENLLLPEAIAKLSATKASADLSSGHSSLGRNGHHAPNPLELLKSVTDFYHKSFFEDKRGVEYLKSRGIKSEEVIRSFKIGFVNGSLRKTLSYSGSMTQDLKEIGILNQDRNEIFYNSIVIPLLDQDGNVVSLYGRNIQRKGHLYLKGPHKGLVNRQGAYGTDKVIFTEAILDALSLYELGIRNVIPLYGAGGFTEDHQELLIKHQIKEVEICFDNDEAGTRGTEELAKKLSIPSSVIKLPEGIKDANEFLVAGKTKEEFLVLPRQIAFPRALLPQGSSGGRNDEEITKEKGALYLKTGDRNYRVLLPEFDSIHSLRVNVKLEIKDKYHIDVVDLYSERQRKSFAKRIGQKFSCLESQIEQDLYKILEELERDRKIPEEGTGAAPVMTEEERREALASLKNPALIQEILSDLGQIGCVGEETNKLLGYLVAVSRKLSEPLSLTIVSQSGAGKSNLADTLESILPKEEVVRLSRITPQALYYMEKTALKHKALIIEEKEGSDSADYSIRVLQSKKSLTLAVPVKDPQTGRMKTTTFEVEGPCSVIQTTTRTHEQNPENLSRVFVIYLDESEDQTRRIHSFQRKQKTLEGQKEKSLQDTTRRKHQNNHRLLNEVTVSIPFVDKIHFPTKWTRTRRDLPRFLNLIESVSFLHQHQRELKQNPDGSFYIESTLEDYSVAYSLSQEIFGDSLSELMKPERDFYERLKIMVQEKEILSFQRRQVRDYTGLPDHLVRRYLETLVGMEYLLVLEGKNGVRFEYKLNPEPLETKEILQGLTTPQELEAHLAETLRKPCGKVNSFKLNGLASPCDLAGKI